MDISSFFGSPSASAIVNDGAFSLAVDMGESCYVGAGQYQKTSFVNTPFFYGPGIINVNGVLQSLSPSATLPPPPINNAPNSQAEIISYSAGGARMNIAGTGTIAPITIIGNTTGSTQVALTISGSIGDTKIGDFGSMSGTGVDPSLTICPMRIIAIGTDTLTVQLPNNRYPSVSASGTFTTQNVGMSASVGDGDAADGWVKATTLMFWREDNLVNLLPNGLYAFGCQKGATTQEALYLQWPYDHSQPSLGDMPLGKTISFGAAVYQKVKGGTGTWAPFIAYVVDGVTTTIEGPSGSGATEYEWSEVSTFIPINTSQVLCGVGFNGTTGDTYYMANPVYSTGNFIGPFNYQKPRNEWLVPFISTAPISYRGATVSFPATADTYNSYSCVFDAYAETFGSIGKSVRALSIAIEGVNGNPVITSSTAGRFFGLRDVTANPAGAGTHYSPLMRQQVQAVASEIGGIYYLDGNGNAVAYSAVASDGWNLLSMDIASYLLS